MNVGYQAPSPPWRGSRASTPRSSRQEAAILFTQHISSQSTQVGEALRKPVKRNSKSVRREISRRLTVSHPPQPASQAVQDESAYAGPNGGTWKGSPSPPGPRSLLLAGNTFSVQGHQPQTPTTRREHTKVGLFSQERKKADQQHTGISPCDSFHSSSRASLAFGRVHVVPDSAEALAQAEGGQVDLEQSVSHGIMGYTSALSPLASQLLLLELAVKLGRHMAWSHR